MTKPLVFNYRNYEDLKEKLEVLEKENEKLKHDNRNLQIRCRIAETNINEMDKVILDEVIKLREEIQMKSCWWIPCSVKLPEKNVRVLASTFDNDVIMATLKEDENGGLFWSTGSFPLMVEVVKAWQPKPKHYEEVKGGAE